MRTEIDGMAELRRALVNVDAEGMRMVKREVARATLNIQTGAKERVAVDTGRLRNSIAIEFERDGLTGIVGTNVDYAPYQEFGTSVMPAHPFLFPAAEEEYPRFVERLRAALNEGLVRADRPGRRG